MRTKEVKDLVQKVWCLEIIVNPCQSCKTNRKRDFVLSAWANLQFSIHGSTVKLNCLHRSLTSPFNLQFTLLVFTISVFTICLYWWPGLEKRLKLNCLKVSWWLCLRLHCIFQVFRECIFWNHVGQNEGFLSEKLESDLPSLLLQ